MQFSYGMASSPPSEAARRHVREGLIRFHEPAWSVVHLMLATLRPRPCPRSSHDGVTVELESVELQQESLSHGPTTPGHFTNDLQAGRRRYAGLVIFMVGEAYDVSIVASTRSQSMFLQLDDGSVLAQPWSPSSSQSSHSRHSSLSTSRRRRPHSNTTKHIEFSFADNNTDRPRPASRPPRPQKLNGISEEVLADEAATQRQRPSEFDNEVEDKQFAAKISAMLKPGGKSAEASAAHSSSAAHVASSSFSSSPASISSKPFRSSHQLGWLCHHCITSSIFLFRAFCAHAFRRSNSRRHPNRPLRRPRETRALVAGDARLGRAVVCVSSHSTVRTVRRPRPRPNRWEGFEQHIDFFTQNTITSSAKAFTYSPYPDYDSKAYRQKWKGRYQSCNGLRGIPFNETVAEVVHAYKRTPNSPGPDVGSFEALGLDADVCFDRYSRLGPFAVSGNELQTLKLGELQNDCLARNSDRFWISAAPELRLPRFIIESAIYVPPPTIPLLESGQQEFRPRTAVLIRAWEHYEFELTTSRPCGEDEFYSHEELFQEKLMSVPEELRDMTILWSEQFMSKLYPDVGEYRVLISQFMAVQWFMETHPEFEFVWNWEMDARLIGQHYAFTETVAEFARKAPRKYLWERNARYYIPDVHGTYEEFFNNTNRDIVNSKWINGTIWGPVPFESQPPLGPEPPHSEEEDNYEWGVGEGSGLHHFAAHLGSGRHFMGLARRPAPRLHQHPRPLLPAHAPRNARREPLRQVNGLGNVAVVGRTVPRPEGRPRPTPHLVHARVAGRVLGRRLQRRRLGRGLLQELVRAAQRRPAPAPPTPRLGPRPRLQRDARAPPAPAGGHRPERRRRPRSLGPGARQRVQHRPGAQLRRLVVVLRERLRQDDLLALARLAADLHRAHRGWMAEYDKFDDIGTYAWEQEHGRLCFPMMLLHPVKHVRNPDQMDEEPTAPRRTPGRGGSGDDIHVGGNDMPCYAMASLGMRFWSMKLVQASMWLGSSL
ncbi:hypothetical protein MRB53_040252 [Persea americana]|nr:hypothetical protein MRB53_040252 [Persea americana]